MGSMLTPEEQQRQQQLQQEKQQAEQKKLKEAVAKRKLGIIELPTLKN